MAGPKTALRRRDRPGAHRLRTRRSHPRPCADRTHRWQRHRQPGAAIRAAEIARDQKITIHTVAVGDPTAAGEEKLDEETLKAVAATTGGHYAHANDRAALADIYAQLDALRTREVQTVSHRPRRELFHWPLAVGVLLSLVYHLAWAVRIGLRQKLRIPATVAAPVAMAAALPIATGLSQFHFLRPWWLLALIPALGLAWLIRRHQDASRPWRGVIDGPFITTPARQGGTTTPPATRSSAAAHLAPGDPVAELARRGSASRRHLPTTRRLWSSPSK